MSKPIFSKEGHFKATIGKRRDGTFSVSTYMVGFGDYHDLQTFVQDGFPSMDEAKSWAVSDLEKSEMDIVQ